jgi:exonuclease III
LIEMELDIVSWNVHGLPRPFDLHIRPWDHSPRHDQRVADGLGRLAALPPAPDIVAFQEVWRDDDNARIRTALGGYEVVESRLS